MKDLKRAFGAPDPEFKERVRQTLFRIEEKEETIVKKKLTFSMAMAMILCVCIAAVSALAGSALLSEKPDVTRPPLSHSESENPSGQPDPHSTDSQSTPVPAASTPQPTPTPGLTPVPDYLYDMTASLIAQNIEVYLLNADDSIYHLDASCDGREHPYRINLLSAVYMGLTACAECVGDGGWFYTAETDPCFHPSADCCGGSDRPLRVTLLEAYALEKTPCASQSSIPSITVLTPQPSDTLAPQPTSAPGLTTPPSATAQPYHPDAQPTAEPRPTLTPMPSAMPDVVYSVTAEVYSAAEQVWPSRGDDRLFHRLPVCGETAAAPAVSLTDALSMGLTPCRECLTCYTGEDSDLYHMSESCIRLSSPQIQLVSTAVQNGYGPCGVCVCFLDLNSGTYHRFARCSAFGDDVNAYIPCSLDFPYLLESAPCELCAAGSKASSLSTSTPMPTSKPDPTESPIPINESASSSVVFLWDSDAPVYHSVYNCSGYEYLHQMDLSDAVAAGLSPCPDCFLAQAAHTDAAIGSLPPAWATGDSEFYFYDYTHGHSGYFHTFASCDAFPMTAPVAISFETAVRYELHPCPECTSLLEQVILAEAGDNSYHVSDECGRFAAPEYLTRYEAKKLGLEPCPICAAGDETNSLTVSTPTPSPMPASTPETVYPSLSGDSLFHRLPVCGETSAAPAVSLIDALNAGLTPCPDCYGSESAYWINGGEAYHHPETPCALFYASSSHFAEVSLTEALLRGKLPCEECVLIPAEDEDFTIFFYTSEDTAYHFDASCASRNASDLLAAYEHELIEMGKEPCKKCIPPEAYGYVFSSETGAFYHLYDDCIGADVSVPRVPIAAAEARLQTACPNCTGDPDFICLISDSSAFYHIEDVLRGVPDSASLSRAVPIKEALDAGKNPCICMGLGASSEKTTRECRADLIGEVYYYSAGGEYYHLESVCGVNEYPDLLRGSQVHEKNLSPCPACLPNRQKTESAAISVDQASSHGIILSDEENAASAR